MEVEIDPEDTVVALWQACDAWSDRAQHVQQRADAGFQEGSRAFSDNAAAAIVEHPPAVSRYLQERAWNLARMLRAVHNITFGTEPGKLFLDPTLLYPLMRAALEDAAAIVWLQLPDDPDERLLRALRALHQDSAHYSKNQLLLARAASRFDHAGGDLSDASRKLTSHMESEKAIVSAHFAQLARELGLEGDAVVAKLYTSAPLIAVYGDDGLERVVWGMLSDLAHFSFMMLRHTSQTVVPETTVPLLHVTMVQFATTMNRVCDDAIVALDRASTLP